MTHPQFPVQTAHDHAPGGGRVQTHSHTTVSPQIVHHLDIVHQQRPSPRNARGLHQTTLQMMVGSVEHAFRENYEFEVLVSNRVVEHATCAIKVLRLKDLEAGTLCKDDFRRHLSVWYANPVYQPERRCQKRFRTNSKEKCLVWCDDRASGP